MFEYFARFFGLKMLIHTPFCVCWIPKWGAMC